MKNNIPFTTQHKDLQFQIIHNEKGKLELSMQKDKESITLSLSPVKIEKSEKTDHFIKSLAPQDILEAIIK